MSTGGKPTPKSQKSGTYVDDRGIDYWRARAAAAESLLRQAEENIMDARRAIWGAIGSLASNSPGALRKELIDVAVHLSKTARKP